VGGLLVVVLLFFWGVEEVEEVGSWTAAGTKVVRKTQVKVWRVRRPRTPRR